MSKRNGGPNPEPISSESSMLAYLPDSEAHSVFEGVGFTGALHEHDGSQADHLETDDDVVIACRGTEPNEWNDLRADANALTDLAETVGRVHRGFKREVDDIWPDLEDAWHDESRNVWFCGHHRTREGESPAVGEQQRHRHPRAAALARLPPRRNAPVPRPPPVR